MVAVCGAVAAGAIGCGGSSESALCKAAGAYGDALAAAQAAGTPSVQNEAGVAAARKFGVTANNLLAAAPGDIKSDLQPYLERLRNGDASLRSDDKLTAIERRLQDRIKADCDIALSLE